MCAQCCKDYIRVDDQRMCDLCVNETCPHPVHCRVSAWGSWGAGGSDETPAATLACWGTASAEDLRQGEEGEREGVVAE